MFYINQRWFSEAEPELGLGIIQGTESKTVQVFYPASNETRTYGQKTSPLKRYHLQVGEEIKAQNGEAKKITDIKEEDNLFFYILDNETICEREINSSIDLNGPKQRVLAGNYDSEQFFRLRYEALLNQRQYQSFAHKGFLGAKIRLIPHQVYLVNEVLQMESPKVMLCDEVGLGKTIEASLILHSLYQKDIIESALIIVPESLSYQWFVELYKKFNLTFDVFNEESEKEDFASRLIISSKILRESEDIYQKVFETKWDMLIVDESHQIDFSSENKVSNLIKKVNRECFSTLFLSATPEVLGPNNLYQALNVLDPQKFSSFESFSKQIEDSISVSKIFKVLKDKESIPADLYGYIPKEEINSLSIDQIKKLLIDRFGTGRSYFRNSRANLENYSKLFTKRVLHPYAIEASEKLSDQIVFKHKFNYLFQLLESLKDKKVLVLCHSKILVLKIQTQLSQASNIKTAIFHSSQSLMERDRSAAFFADPDGAQVLICTEVGSEGRNFEFADQLVLFDIPKVPDQLEQRIGRLDRIGQKLDINIHLPYIKNSFEDTLFHLYHKVFNAFESSPKGSSLFYKQEHEAIHDFLTQEFNQTKLEAFLLNMKASYDQLRLKLESGRDILIESNSYNDQKAKKLLETIREFERSVCAKTYLDEAFNHIGIDVSELNDKSYFIKPSDNMLIPSFPSLSAEGVSLTFEREYALIREDLAFVSLEHPLFKGAIDLCLNSTLGNATYIKQNCMERNIYFELIITLQCVDGFKHTSSLFLPLTPMRVLLNLQGVDVTQKYPKKLIDQNIVYEGLEECAELLKNLPKDSVNELIHKAYDSSIAKSKKYKDQALKMAHEFFELEIQRSISLKSDDDSLAALKNRKLSTERSIKEAKLEISSIRVILPEA